VKLVIEDEAGTRSIVPFASDEITVGRASDGVAFRLSERNVSRRHARFVRQKSDVWVEDLGSLVGTHVNGERIEGRRKLRPGDIVQIGDYDLAVLADGAELPAPAAAAAPPAPPLATPDEPTLALATAEIRAIAASSATPAPAPLPAPFAAAAPEGTLRVAAPRRASSARAALLAGLAALALGAAAGWLVGRYALPASAEAAAGALTRP
jgi:predicted component of type VI protein secretion system